MKKLFKKKCKLFYFAGGGLSFSSLIWKLEKKNNPNNPVNPVKENKMTILSKKKGF